MNRSNFKGVEVTSVIKSGIIDMDDYIEIEINTGPWVYHTYWQLMWRDGLPLIIQERRVAYFLITEVTSADKKPVWTNVSARDYYYPPQLTLRFCAVAIPAVLFHFQRYFENVDGIVIFLRNRAPLDFNLNAAFRNIVRILERHGIKVLTEVKALRRFNSTPGGLIAFEFYIHTLLK